ncbi:phosphatidylserine/phosphatidylglycerophosphate/cardiolipin synthase family protein [Shinella daejeonensis]|uniref:phospholipase D-like domain-containing protein n=1 Tax=Shinella daejeonensis TaxID=659017 RepID=UPI0020C80241|nr:phosphatidylserine/phosphatidylglycerophosphate/cardiolipin synthase family protein [Shinella daejeonensis]MCP8896643.1 phosphatidylserine/phosphatidylglycerophosphate/cardiolipin synthase family protein [Shinella daejeonensis]
MLDTFYAYWPHILVVLSLVLGVPAAIHATMTKEEVRAAIGWVGVIMLSPVVGALLYSIAGVNRIRRKTLNLGREGLLADGHPKTGHEVSGEHVQSAFGGALAAMQRLGDNVSRGRLTSGNRIAMLSNGDEAYGAMLEAIGQAKRSVLLETYIFDRDAVGRRFVETLAAAVRRGVEVRVVIDAVGARYSIPSIVADLRRAGVPVEVFNGNIVMGLRLPYANLRTHRKILVVDGAVGFTGGLNIRAGFSTVHAGEAAALDTHFRVTGPIVRDLFRTAYEDWRFSGGRVLAGPAWQIPAQPDAPGNGMLARVVSSGPDKSVESNHRMLMGAVSIAKRHIHIMSPYFLPDRELISAIATAARRGVEIDIVVPAVNNLKLVDLAMTAQFDQLLKAGCRIWRSAGTFNHSKLTVIDGVWSYIGSSNIDQRSLRLNFEVDIEVIDGPFADLIGRRIALALSQAEQVKLDALRARPFLRRLIERVTWLGSPYL